MRGVYVVCMWCVCGVFFDIVSGDEGFRARFGAIDRSQGEAGDGWGDDGMGDDGMTARDGSFRYPNADLYEWVFESNVWSDVPATFEPRGRAFHSSVAASGASEEEGMFHRLYVPACVCFVSFHCGFTHRLVASS